jgi:hypothetical protein
VALGLLGGVGVLLDEGRELEHLEQGLGLLELELLFQDVLDLVGFEVECEENLHVFENLLPLLLLRHAVVFVPITFFKRTLFEMLPEFSWLVQT